MILLISISVFLTLSAIVLLVYQLATAQQRQVAARLEQVARGRTTLIIAHRLSTIMNADTIVVLQEGRVVETGRHSELVARGGMYAGLWALQQDEKQAENR